MLILGVDPGSRLTGYGIINAVGNRLVYVDCGCIRLGNGSHPERLQTLFRELGTVIDRHCPQQCAVEDVFVGKSASSALKLGQARGSAMVACLDRDLPLSEYPARKVKQAVTGNGNASKEQVQHMVRVLLGLQGELQEDAGDALAVAICHANTRESLSRVTSARTFRRGRFS